MCIIAFSIFFPINCLVNKSVINSLQGQSTCLTKNNQRSVNSGYYKGRILISPATVYKTYLSTPPATVKKNYVCKYYINFKTLNNTYKLQSNYGLFFSQKPITNYIYFFPNKYRCLNVSPRFMIIETLIAIYIFLSKLNNLVKKLYRHTYYK